MEVRRATKVVLIFFLVLAILAAAVLAFAFYQDSRQYGLIPARTSINNIDVSSMTRDKAEQVLKADLDSKKSGYELTLKAGDKTAVIPLSEALSYNLNPALDQALEPSTSENLIGRMSHALKQTFLGTKPEPRNFEVGYSFEAPEVKGEVEKLAQEIDVQPVNAERTINGDSVTITPESAGKVVNVDQSVDAINAALEPFKDGSLPSTKNLAVDMVVEDVNPEVTAASFGKAITVNLSTHTLKLFNGDQVEKTYKIGCGMPGHETPTGLLKIVNKRKNPTWVNPDPQGWGSTMPEKIEPGPDNPLGERALDLNRRAIRIHGVSNPGKIGVSKSHGCINMLNPDVVDLFDRVSVGTPVNVHS